MEERRGTRREAPRHIETEEERQEVQLLGDVQDDAIVLVANREDLDSEIERGGESKSAGGDGDQESGDTIVKGRDQAGAP